MQRRNEARNLSDLRRSPKPKPLRYFWLVAARALVGLAIGGIIVPFDNLADAWCKWSRNTWVWEWIKWMFIPPKMAIPMWRGPCVLPIHVENEQSTFSQVAALGGYDGGPVIKQQILHDFDIFCYCRFCVWRLVGPGRSWCKGQQDREDQGSIVYDWKCESEQCETVTGLECVRRNIDAICRFHFIELFCLLAA